MDELEPIILLIVSGLLLRFSLTFTGQAWAKSHAQTVTFMVLPIITYVITKTISGNIALSLGMIGALSIVRFRHPVKSALELIIYFDLITIGIATSVRTKWSIQLVICTIVIILLVKLAQNILKKNNKNFYNLSFNEGTDLNTLEITSSEQNKDIENNESIKRIVYDKTKGYNYLLTFESSKELKNFKKEIEKHSSIEKIDVNLV
mgnify:CR=1 FL=1